VLDSALHHLGDNDTPEWKEAPAKPEGARLDVRFTSGANASEWTLFLRQRSVDNPWRLKVNDVEIAKLRTGPDLVERWYALPAGCVKAGENVLSVVPDVPTDDIVVGELRLVEASLRELYRLQPVSVSVRDAASQQPLPVRVTIATLDGRLAPIYYGESTTTAQRDGILYTANGQARFEIAPGNYVCYATRGAEWSLASSVLTVVEGAQPRIELAVRREVDTTGFVAADTHIHTLQFSGHGDSSALERQVTLAGEGVELAISTDHNHNIDYGPFQREVGVTQHYTAVCGNEVTTKVGHFNAFPLRPSDPVPPHDSLDYVTIVRGIRAAGAKVVILNHPRWPHFDDSPFGDHHLDRLLGRFDPPFVLPVDATEMVNSTTEQPDGRELFLDWFGLLNGGTRIFAVGSSDSHTVGDPVGQGRTYVASSTDDPARIDVGEACDALREGRTSVSLGIFATALVGGRPAMGASFDRSTDPAPFELDVVVRSASWIRPRTLTVFVNGLAEFERELRPAAGKPLDETHHVSLPLATKNDAWIVALVEGDAAATPAWPELNPYTLAATNPIFVDRDGGGYSSPASAAAAFAPKATADSMRARLAEVDRTHAVQLLAAWSSALRSKGAGADSVRAQLTATAAARAAEPEIAALLARY
jgi:hypothetical protein